MDKLNSVGERKRLHKALLLAQEGAQQGSGGGGRLVAQAVRDHVGRLAANLSANIQMQLMDRLTVSLCMRLYVCVLVFVRATPFVARAKHSWRQYEAC